jgi:hypothetical protein
MAMIRYSDEDRRRMRAEKIEQAEIDAELTRLYDLYARIARPPANAAEAERMRRLTRVQETLQIRPYGDDRA